MRRYAWWETILFSERYGHTPRAWRVWCSSRAGNWKSGRNNPNLILEHKLVTRKGKTHMQGYWVRPFHEESAPATGTPQVMEAHHTPQGQQPATGTPQPSAPSTGAGAVNQDLSERLKQGDAYQHLLPHLTDVEALMLLSTLGVRGGGNLMLLSPPGVGKSYMWAELRDAMYQWRDAYEEAEKRNKEYPEPPVMVTVLAMNAQAFQSTESFGIASRVAGKEGQNPYIEFLFFRDLERDVAFAEQHNIPHVIVLDEFTKTETPKQMLTLLSNRQIGPRRLPKNTSFVLLGNEEEVPTFLDRAGMALIDRCVFATMSKQMVSETMSRIGQSQMQQESDMRDMPSEDEEKLSTLAREIRNARRMYEDAAAQGDEAAAKQWSGTLKALRAEYERLQQQYQRPSSQSDVGAVASLREYVSAMVAQQPLSEAIRAKARSLLELIDDSQYPAPSRERVNRRLGIRQALMEMFLSEDAKSVPFAQTLLDNYLEGKMEVLRNRWRSSRELPYFSLRRFIQIPAVIDALVHAGHSIDSEVVRNILGIAFGHNNATFILDRIKKSFEEMNSSISAHVNKVLDSVDESSLNQFLETWGVDPYTPSSGSESPPSTLLTFDEKAFYDSLMSAFGTNANAVVSRIASLYSEPTTGEQWNTYMYEKFKTILTDLGIDLETGETTPKSASVGLEQWRNAVNDLKRFVALYGASRYALAQLLPKRLDRSTNLPSLDEERVSSEYQSMTHALTTLQMREVELTGSPIKTMHLLGSGSGHVASDKPAFIIRALVQNAEGLITQASNNPQLSSDPAWSQVRDEFERLAKVVLHLGSQRGPNFREGVS